MGTCRFCGKDAKTISDVIGFCKGCIQEHFQEIRPKIEKVHIQSRRMYSLPSRPPRHEGGRLCKLCMHGCKISEGETGYCALRKVEGGRMSGGGPRDGNLSFYHDPLPTNCVADFVCPGGTGSGFPRYATTQGPEYGYQSLAVFYHSCSFNCLYCQNHHFKEHTASPLNTSAFQLARAVGERTHCICYFGGDPSPQVLHAIKASRLALERKRGKVLRICWETNGAVMRPFLLEMARLSLISGGCIKFDLKAWSPDLHYALCQVGNSHTFQNFATLSQWSHLRPISPFLIASTPLVPGYVDEEEVEGIATFIAELDPEIPYSLLAFHPHFFLHDLPTTSKGHAFRCLEAGKKAGLKRIHLGNRHLLGEDY